MSKLETVLEREIGLNAEQIADVRRAAAEDYDGSLQKLLQDALDEYIGQREFRIGSDSTYNHVSRPSDFPDEFNRKWRSAEAAHARQELNKLCLLALRNFAGGQGNE